MKKRLISMVLGLSMAFILLVGCGDISEPTTQDMSELTTLERIQKAQSFGDIIGCSTLMKEDENSGDEEKNALSNVAISYLLSDDKLNGTYYYNEYFLKGTFGERDYGKVCLLVRGNGMSEYEDQIYRNKHKSGACRSALLYRVRNPAINFFTGNPILQKDFHRLIFANI